MKDKEFVLNAIATYGQEFVTEVWEKLPQSEFGPLESMVLYGVIRERKPQYVVEIGTEQLGRSTHVLQRALRKNTVYKRHVLCDFPGIVEYAYGEMHRQGMDMNRITYVSGDIQQTYPALDLEEIDFLLIDADHSKQFAAWYLDTIIPKLPLKTMVLVHDVNLSADWIWRPTPGSEVEEFLERKSIGRLPLKKVAWLEDWYQNEEYTNDLTALKSKFPIFTESLASSSSYWLTRKILTL